MAGGEAWRAWQAHLAEAAPRGGLRPWRVPRLRADHHGGGRRLPGRPFAGADLGPPRLGDRGRGVRWRARLPGRVRPSVRPARGRGHPAALDRGTERGCRRRAHAAGPPCPADPRQGAHGVTLMVWTPPDGIDVPRWWCLATTRGGVHGPG